MRGYFPSGAVGGMVLPGLVAPELPGIPVPAPLEVPLLPLLMPGMPLLPLDPVVLEPPMLLPALPGASGMPREEPDMLPAPAAPEPALPEVPELSGMLLLLLLLLLPVLLPMLPLPEAPEPAAEWPDIEPHAASAKMHATSVICFIMKVLLSFKDMAHMRLSSRCPKSKSRSKLPGTGLRINRNRSLPKVQVSGLSKSTIWSLDLFPLPVR